ncbi:unnamed protein product [Triticum turgidum subsp. durum]|uniref:Phytocyanin domain-containing protein n=1 Tax=Triticum turgidum subsp. durum TaxID=4567 RepID=A0A9R1PH02_TRITD|nr:unnamed protein product [Triticum turgidum subsp. durum]
MYACCMKIKLVVPSSDACPDLGTRTALDGPTALDVVKVSASEYEACAARRGAKVLKSGADRVTLALGPSYFICSVPAQCQAGIKIAVVARKQGRVGGAS